MSVSKAVSIQLSSQLAGSYGDRRGEEGGEGRGGGCGKRTQVQPGKIQQCADCSYSWNQTVAHLLPTISQMLQ